MHGKEAMIKNHVKTKRTPASFPIQDWLVVSTHLKNISQNGKLPQIGMNIKSVWNHHPEEISRQDLLNGPLEPEYLITPAA